MTVESDGINVRLIGRCPAEDTEALLSLLTVGIRRLDLEQCEGLHGAVVQLLMAARPEIVRERSGFLRDWIIPLIRKQDSP